MSRRADPARIDVARRSATIARLVGAGELPDRATALVDRWQATTLGARDRADWESFDAWLDRERHGPPEKDRRS
ncbi:MAG: hypothetical protein M3Q66_01365 [Chloroflexota bacterium]|nr:hypothetical protein [Chloroflexota bacterium]